MKIRSGFSGMPWLFSLGASMVLGPAIAVLAHANSTNGDTTVRSNPNQTLQSAVQRELQTLYASNGITAPTRPIQRKIRQVSATESGPVTTAEATAASSKTVVSEKQDAKPGLLRRLLPFNIRPLAKSTSDKRQDAPPAAHGAHRSNEHRSSCKQCRQAASQSKSSPIQKTAREVESTRPATTNRRPRSAIEEELQKLYARDGKQMPSMRLSEMPMAKKGARQAGPAIAPVPAGPVQQARKSWPKALLGRFFPSRKSKPVNSAVVRSERVRQPVASSSITRQTQQPPRKMQLLPMEGLQERGELTVVKTVKKVKPSAEKPVDDPLDNAFPDLSEVDADKNATSPFSGLTLDEKTPTGTELPVQKVAATDSPKTEDAGDKVEPEVKPAAGPTTAEAPSSQETPQQDKFQLIASRSNMTGLKGFCPVALRDRRELLEAKPEFSVTFKAKTYQFSSEEAKASFEESPATYLPAKDGRDVILLAAGEESVEGSLDHAAWYKGRLYLFSNAETLETFTQSPSEHSDKDSSNAVSSLE